MRPKSGRHFEQFSYLMGDMTYESGCVDCFSDSRYVFVSYLRLLKEFVVNISIDYNLNGYLYWYQLSKCIATIAADRLGRKEFHTRDVGRHGVSFVLFSLHRVKALALKMGSKEAIKTALAKEDTTGKRDELRSSIVNYVCQAGIFEGIISDVIAKEEKKRWLIQFLNKTESQLEKSDTNSLYQTNPNNQFCLLGLPFCSAYRRTSIPYQEQTFISCQPFFYESSSDRGHLFIEGSLDDEWKLSELHKVSPISGQANSLDSNDLQKYICPSPNPTEVAEVVGGASEPFVTEPAPAASSPARSSTGSSDRTPPDSEDLSNMKNFVFHIFLHRQFKKGVILESFIIDTVQKIIFFFSAAPPMAEESEFSRHLNLQGVLLQLIGKGSETEDIGEVFTNCFKDYLYVFDAIQSWELQKEISPGGLEICFYCSLCYYLDLVKIPSKNPDDIREEYSKFKLETAQLFELFLSILDNYSKIGIKTGLSP